MHTRGFNKSHTQYVICIKAKGLYNIHSKFSNNPNAVYTIYIVQYLYGTRTLLKKKTNKKMTKFALFRSHFMGLVKSKFGID